MFFMHDHDYINENGKKVAGTAAFLHHVSGQGGIEAYNKGIIRAGIEAFLESPEGMATVNQLANANVKRSRIQKKDCG